MIAFVTGTLHKKEESAILLLVGGIGYRVFCTKKTLQKCTASPHELLFFHTHHYIREEKQSLFGFLEQEECMFFEHLLSLSGIGPKIALEILEYPLAQVFQAIADEEVAFLSQIKGLGKKTASRMILELKGSLPSLALLEGEEGRSAYLREDILEALLRLGFSKERAAHVVSLIPPEKTSDEDALKWALQQLSSS